MLGRDGRELEVERVSIDLLDLNPGEVAERSVVFAGAKAVFAGADNVALYAEPTSGHPVYTDTPIACAGYVVTGVAVVLRFDADLMATIRAALDARAAASVADGRCLPERCPMLVGGGIAHAAECRRL